MRGNDCRCPGCGMCGSAEDAERLRRALRGLARGLLILSRAATKQAQSEEDADRPWPEWAETARANGWKPPKGWRP